MPRKRRTPKTRRAEISAEMMNYLSDREMDSKAWIFFQADTEILAAWNVARDEILTAWSSTDPGTRPSHWWKFDAPRQALGTFEGCYYDGKLPEPRRRLGGIGTPAFEVSALVDQFEWGLPGYWVTRADVDRRGPAFEGVAIDSSDPPRYESEASYLRRLDLLLPTELGRLTEEDFEPDTIEAEAEAA